MFLLTVSGLALTMLLIVSYRMAKKTANKPLTWNVPHWQRPFISLGDLMFDVVVWWTSQCIDCKQVFGDQEKLGQHIINRTYCTRPPLQ